MYSIAKARKLMQKEPESQSARCLSALVLALENAQPFQIQGIYELPYEHFELAVDVIKDWRLDRHYSAKARFRLIDAAVHMDELGRAKKDA